jgi:hypothetical protein
LTSKPRQTLETSSGTRTKTPGARLHITLNLPTTTGITGSTPRQETHLQNKRRDRTSLALAHAEADQTEAAAKGRRQLAGDWNAVLATTDRASG